MRNFLYRFTFEACLSGTDENIDIADAGAGAGAMKYSDVGGHRNCITGEEGTTPPWTTHDALAVLTQRSALLSET